MLQPLPFSVNISGTIRRDSDHILRTTSFAILLLGMEDHYWEKRIDVVDIEYLAILCDGFWEGENVTLSKVFFATSNDRG